MVSVLDEIIRHGGKTVRHAGGFWSWPGCPRMSHNGQPEWHAGTATIEALVKRGELAYVEWREGRNGRFPVAAMRSNTAAPDTIDHRSQPA